MAGLYVHIPFCRSRCIYCAFYSTTSLELRQRYVDAVCREIELRGERRNFRGERREERGERLDTRLDTIYLGGGTPSQLTIDQLRQLFLSINNVYGQNHSLSSLLSPLSSNTEVTIEVNPDDVTEAFAEALTQLPVNRVSMGAQTFDDDRLRFLHRRHTASQVPLAIERLRKAGIENISVDLMYGFPGETLADWQRDIDAALALQVEHLSAYCLMVEEGTPLYDLYRGHGGTQVRGYEHINEELERAMYEMLIDRLTAAGYEHYELSNFARPGRRSRHNSSYWQDVPYLGVGAAAHSYDGRRRWWNVSDLHLYIKGIEEGTCVSEGEDLDEDTRYNDRITTALRTCEGLDLTMLPEKYRRYCLQEARRYLDDGLLQLDDAMRLQLTRRGLFVSDMVMSGLMWV